MAATWLNSSRRETCGSLSAYVVIVIAVVIFFTTLASAYGYHLVGPVRDLWAILPLLESWDRGEGFLNLLLGSHGGHRLVFPRLLYLTDYLLFDGRNFFLLGAAVVLQLTLFAMVVRVVVARCGALRASERGFVFGLVAAVAFSSTQLENFIRPWNVHWFVCGTAVVLSLAALLPMQISMQAGAGRTDDRDLKLGFSIPRQLTGHHELPISCGFGPIRASARRMRQTDVACILAPREMGPLGE
jgi:hypothetical protein